MSRVSLARRGRLLRRQVALRPLRLPAPAGAPIALVHRVDLFELPCQLRRGFAPSLASPSAATTCAPATARA